MPRPLRFICLRILAKVLLIQADPETEHEPKETQIDAFRELRLQLNVSFYTFAPVFLVYKSNVMQFAVNLLEGKSYK